MMKHTIFQALAVASTLALVACGSGNADVKEKLGLKVSPPDEFSVVTRAPLVVPPDYTLRPPRPGAERPNELSVREETRKTVFGVSDTAPARQAESGNSDFLNKLGASQSDPNIRSSINTEVRAMDDKERPVADKLLFWKEKEAPGKTIDPVEEQKRIQASGEVQPAATTTTTTKTTTKTDGMLSSDDQTSSGGATTIRKRNEDILQTP